MGFCYVERPQTFAQPNTTLHLECGLLVMNHLIIFDLDRKLTTSTFSLTYETMVFLNRCMLFIQVSMTTIYWQSMIQIFKLLVYCDCFDFKPLCLVLVLKKKTYFLSTTWNSVSLRAVESIKVYRSSSINSMIFILNS